MLYKKTASGQEAVCLMFIRFYVERKAQADFFSGCSVPAATALV